MTSSAAASATAQAPAGRLGMWVFLVTDAMSFAALLIAYAVLRARGGGWSDFAAHLDLPVAALATFLLLGSSLTAVLAADAAQAGRSPRGWLVATLVLGGAVLTAQTWEYAALARRGVEFSGTPAVSSFFVLTGWHGAHLFAGLVYLVVVAARGRRDRVPTAALFWQFLAAVWILLFTALHLV
jgi:cytochrome c oxidase subunit III